MIYYKIKTKELIINKFNDSILLNNDSLLLSNFTIDRKNSIRFFSFAISLKNHLTCVKF